MVRASDFSSSLASRDECSAEDHPHFLESATKLAAALRHTIFVDQVCTALPPTDTLFTVCLQVVYPYALKQDVMALLEEHITENIVKAR